MNPAQGSSRNPIRIPPGPVQRHLRQWPGGLLQPFAIVCENGAFLKPISGQLKNVTDMGSRLARRIFAIIQNPLCFHDSFETVTVGQKGLPSWHQFIISPLWLASPWLEKLFGIQVMNITAAKLGQLFANLIQSQASPFAGIITDADRKPGSILLACGCKTVFDVPDDWLIGRNVSILKSDEHIEDVRSATARHGGSWTGTFQPNTGCGPVDSFVVRDGPFRIGLHRKLGPRTPSFGASLPPGPDYQDLLNQILPALAAANQRRPAATDVEESDPANGEHVKKGKFIDARMQQMLRDKPESLFWSTGQWADALQCAKSTIVETKTWKEQCSEARDAQRVERVLRQHRQQGRSEDI